jgi:hypothetical protein
MLVILMGFQMRNGILRAPRTGLTPRARFDGLLLKLSRGERHEDVRVVACPPRTGRRTPDYKPG